MTAAYRRIILSVFQPPSPITIGAVKPRLRTHHARGLIGSQPRGAAVVVHRRRTRRLPRPRPTSYPVARVFQRKGFVVVAIMRLPLSFVSPRRSIRRATLAPGILACRHPFLLFEANRNRRTAHGREQ